MTITSIFTPQEVFATLADGFEVIESNRRTIVRCAECGRVISVNPTSIEDVDAFHATSPTLALVLILMGVLPVPRGKSYDDVTDDLYDLFLTELRLEFVALISA